MNVRILIIIAILGLVYMLREFLLIMFVAFLLTTGLLPIVRWLKRKKIPRSLSAFILVATILIAPVALMASVGPALIDQGASFIQNIPSLTQQLEDRYNVDLVQETQSRIEDNSEQIISNAFALTGSFVEAFLGFIIVLVVTVYWLIFYVPTKKAIISFLGGSDRKRQKFASEAYENVETRLGRWIKGQLLISVAVGLLTWVVLLILGIPYAGLLAAIAAVLEIIPTLGPILAAVPALLIAITISPQTFIIVLIAYVVIQQVESYLIAPRLMGQAVHMSPFAILIALLAGTSLLGILGALLAVPVTLTLQEIYRAYKKHADVLKI